ncbi:hypothetical protein FVEN_g6594 [Fusarium venenatum]|uniref:Uncharacterized protein n=1 Tax=Fusarium venenatum TaxID=56646 RepID=A0A2L2ST79_9HYPO|nr:uncharacterized protein FVRRES_04898 [Fusarium venenatum]KAG8355569.1 hypothetical protein FVEN_g6594 [Fusarium venenatum]KAH6992030.1 hypothetical protein EDB82DRAFT_126192 [Fusarium venenatum]CEI60462.1 unnamed protein product [Fusarium venenatum]
MPEKKETPIRKPTKFVRFAESPVPSTGVMDQPRSRASGQTPALRPTGQGDPFEDFSEICTLKDIDPSIFTMAEFNGTTGMYTDPKNEKLLDVSKYISTAAGYVYTTYKLNSSGFQAEIEKKKSEKEDIKIDFEDLWLDLQFFWDLFLRMQPNCITSKKEYTKQAVDFLLDLSVAILLPDVRPEWDVSAARMQIQCFRRRLRRLQLLLRTDMNKCKTSPVMLCGCVVGVKRPKHKEGLWTPLFGNSVSSPHDGADDRAFRVRDIAGMLKLDDYLAHVWYEFQSRPGPEKDDSVKVIRTALGSTDKEIKQYIPKKEYKHPEDVKAEWVNALLHPSFRAAVVREVNVVVGEAMSFHDKYGQSAHRWDCDK